ncbi:hypothetical protein [Pleionea sp. CnH1-48]|uniref:hypothetical protein n=1 Tax=Pleionea sp. CnH1-48 TaxID=2954494 RepID=UPI002097CDED|nr:hypothetical protein [Pleionea sp. CnH1-48]MCO7223180.1 hypothetical protein [Pleionea sp. CnH1-48]
MKSLLLKGFNYIKGGFRGFASKKPLVKSIVMIQTIDFTVGKFFSKLAPVFTKYNVKKLLRSNTNDSIID